MAFDTMFPVSDHEREIQKKIYQELEKLEEMFIVMCRQLKSTWGAWSVIKIQTIKEKKALLKKKYQF